MSDRPPWDEEDSIAPWDEEEVAPKKLTGVASAWTPSGSAKPKKRSPLSLSENVQQQSTGLLSGLRAEAPNVLQRFANLGSDWLTGQKETYKDQARAAGLLNETPEDISAQVLAAEKKWKARQEFEKSSAPAPNENFGMGLGRLGMKAAPQIALGIASGGASVPVQAGLGGGLEMLQSLSEGDTPGQAGFRTALAGAAPFAGRGANALFTKMKNPFTGKVDEAARAAFERLGTEAPASAITHSKPASLVEQGAGFMIGGQKVTDRAEKALSTLNTRAEELAAGANPYVAGQNLSEDIAGRISSLQGAKNAEYGKIGNLKQYPAAAEQTLAEIDGILERGTASPDVLDRLKALRSAIAPAEPDTGDLGQFANDPKMAELIRTQMGKEAPAPTPRSVADLMSQQAGIEYGGPNALADEALGNRLRDLLGKDYDAALAAAAPDQAEQLAKAKEAYGLYADMRKSLPGKMSAKLAQAGQFDKLVPSVVRPKASIKDIRTVLEVASPETVDQVRKNVLADIVGYTGEEQGKAGAVKLTPGQVRKAIKRWGPDVLKEVLDSKQYGALQDLAIASEAMGKATRISGGSQTMPLLRASQYLSYPATLFGMLVSGNLPGAALTAGGAGMEAATAAGIGSKAGQRWLTTGLGAATRPGMAAGGAMMGLAKGVGQKNDEARRRLELDALLAK